MIEIGHFRFYPEDYNAMERSIQTVDVPVSAMVTLDEELGELKKLNANSIREFAIKMHDKLEERNEIIIDLLRLINSTFSMDSCTQKVDDDFLDKNREYLTKELKRYSDLKMFFLDSKDFETECGCSSDFCDLLIFRDLFVANLESKEKVK